MSENFFNNSLNTGLNNRFRFTFPERTMRQVKESALNLLKDVAKPIINIGEGKEDILNGSVAKEISTYQKMINSVNSSMAASDAYFNKSLDIKS